MAKRGIVILHVEVLPPLGKARVFLRTRLGMEQSRVGVVPGLQYPAVAGNHHQFWKTGQTEVQDLRSSATEGRLGATNMLQVEGAY